MQEITIELRENALSIQGDNIHSQKELAKKILQDALDALDKEPAAEFKNEIVYKK